MIDKIFKTFECIQSNNIGGVTLDPLQTKKVFNCNWSSRAVVASILLKSGPINCCDAHSVSRANVH